ncbi:MAG: DMT family transporter [Alkalinema sp. RU_4_3]|nr:DMT family transporter [Alkalinema sp. RU_4_3]
MRSSHFSILHVWKRIFGNSQGIGLIVLSTAIYGLTMAVTKGTLDYIPPLTLLTVQTASSVLLFWTIVVVRRIPVQWNRQTVQVGLSGLLEPGLSYLCGMLGLSMTTASDAALLGTLEPIATIAFAWLFLKERVGKLLLGLGGLACLGVLFVAMPEGGGAVRSSLPGNLLVMMSVVFAALYVIVTSRSIGQMSPVLLAALQQSAALGLFAIIEVWACFHGEHLVWQGGTGWSLVVAVLSGAFGYGLAFLLYLEALRRRSASEISLYLALVPVFGAIAAYVVLGERLLPVQGLGGMLILLAVVGVSKLPGRGV